MCDITLNGKEVQNAIYFLSFTRLSLTAMVQGSSKMLIYIFLYPLERRINRHLSFPIDDTIVVGNILNVSCPNNRG